MTPPLRQAVVCCTPSSRAEGAATLTQKSDYFQYIEYRNQTVASGAEGESGAYRPCGQEASTHGRSESFTDLLRPATMSGLGTIADNALPAGSEGCKQTAHSHRLGRVEAVLQSIPITFRATGRRPPVHPANPSLAPHRAAFGWSFRSSSRPSLRGQRRLFSRG